MFKSANGLERAYVADDCPLTVDAITTMKFAATTEKTPNYPNQVSPGRIIKGTVAALKPTVPFFSCCPRSFRWFSKFL